jgi:hypothetical protein
MEQDIKKCHYCGEEILETAKKCKHCGEWLEAKCPYCGEEIETAAKKCKHCGEWLKAKIGESGDQSKKQKESKTPDPVVIIQDKKSNGAGTAGFVLALIAVFFGWIPVLGWILWILGLILSFAGVFKSPRGLAIAGLVISLIDLILLVTIFGAILAAIGTL